MILKKSLIYRYRNGMRRKYYVCEKYPNCKESHSAHPDGTPLGIPAKKDIRDLRRYVHDLAHTLWSRSDRMAIKEMYVWMEANTRTGHISQMLEWELMDLEHKLIELINNKK